MLLFKPEHQIMIVEGRKTETRRVWKSRRVKPGSIQLAKTKMLSPDYFAKLRILDVHQERLGDITLESARAEGYESLEAFKAAWIKINGFWDDNLVVWVVKFEAIL